MAKEELLQQIGISKIFEVKKESDIKNTSTNKSILIESGNKKLREATLKKIKKPKEYVIFIKNIEEYDMSLLESLGSQERIILSGNIDDCNFKKELIKIKRKSKIIFTVPKIDLYVDVPHLQRYQSYFVSKNMKGILELKQEEIVDIVDDQDNII